VEHSPRPLQAQALGDIRNLSRINVLAKELVGHSQLVGRLSECQQLAHSGELPQSSMTVVKVWLDVFW
jgi:hypothetical protein